MSRTRSRKKKLSAGTRGEGKKNGRGKHYYKDLVPKQRFGGLGVPEIFGDGHKHRSRSGKKGCVREEKACKKKSFSWV